MEHQSSFWLSSFYPSSHVFQSLYPSLSLFSTSIFGKRMRESGRAFGVIACRALLSTFRHPVFMFSNKSVPLCRDSTLHGLQCSKPRIDWTLKQLFMSDTCPFSPSQSADARICTGVLHDLGNLVPSGLTDALLIHVLGSFHCWIVFLKLLKFV